MKTVKRNRTKTKSRTSVRPALKHKRFSKKSFPLTLAFGWVGSLVTPAAYIFAVLILFQFVSVQFVLGFYKNPAPQNPPMVNLAAQVKKPLANAPAAAGLPVRLKIPSLKVNAAVRYVGLTPNGSMGIPKLPLETAWYMLGPKPGEKGSAVIAGHVNWLYGATGIFEDLKDLKPGDVISVQNDKGINIPFVVRETRTLGQKDDASDVFLSYDGKSHLNLVTCDGVWDKVAKVYSKRLVVFADKVTE